MKAHIKQEKSFDKESHFVKEIKTGDMKKFFTLEGEYLERLCKIMEERGESGDKFTVTYTVEVTI